MKNEAETDIQSTLKLLEPALSVFINFYASSDPEEDDSGKILRGNLQPRTEELLKIIPADALSELLSMYRILTLNDKAKKYRNTKKNFPSNKLIKIETTLQEFVKEGWLTEGKVDSLLAEIKTELATGEKGTEYIFYKTFKRATVGNRTNRPKDNPAFILFVVLLIDLLVAIDGKLHGELVADVIYEQILNADDNAERTDKGAKSVSRRSIELCYSRNQGKKQTLIELINGQAEAFSILLDLPIQSSPLEISPSESHPIGYLPVKSAKTIPPDRLNKLLHLFFEK
jgi:hypothetical protein